MDNNSDHKKKDKNKKETKKEKKAENALEKKIKKLEEENEDLEKRLKRALADYQNLNKNVIAEKAEFIKYSLSEFFLEILPVYENLKMAISTLKEEDTNNPWVEGIKYVIKQFHDVFKANGLEEIETIGQKFDYNCMEAVEGQGEVVEQEIKKGYRLKGKVIIPARVILEKKDSSVENNPAENKDNFL